MEAAMLRGLVEVQSRTSDGPPSPPDEGLVPLAAPAKAVHRTYPGAPHQADTIEMQRAPGQHDAGESGSVTPRADNDSDLEMSPPATPGPAAEPVEAMASVWEPSMNRFRLLAVCLANLGNALSDGAAGALIPYMEKYYHIGYGVVSLIFVGQAVGFIVAAVVLDTLRAKLGQAKVLGLGQALMTLAYIPLAAAAPFVLVALSFFFIGFGIAINVAMGNIFCGRLQNGTLMLGLLHGSYGVGGTTGPLVATALVTAAGAVWSRYYLLTLGIGVATVALSLWSFWDFERELSPAAREREEQPASSSMLLLGSMVTALRMRVVLLGAVFIFAYQGAEVSISGWVISFLIQARGGDPSSVGYVSAGFWAGITLGRFCLSGPAQRIGEKGFVYGLVVGAVAFQVLVWWVPNIVGEAVAVSIVGLLLGPIYPCAAAVFMRGMSRRDALSGMGTISACGSLGGAVAPFVTGLLAQAVGTYVLHPIVIALFVVMLLCWYGVPSPEKRTE
ncbi:major facilitator superfamily protein [Hirsutella rhossiliensis]|uniref:Major facilitator superfamily domain-containing protein n=1 Tax=Hirsutella rhossiliensis TaxID=111463 RepID=A0A9P8SMV0_9HYPO|nr:major facilitator superfamily domain-containing protein [Hirsutella rhossiliensis]KAH0966516.1 major facilitator superfamily domain-containing protein [Hirsutella rhossiliensis]